MQVPGLPSLFLAFYLLIFLPLVAWRSRRLLESRRQAARLAAGAAPGTAGEAEAASILPSRGQIWTQTLLTQLLLLALAYLVGDTFGYRLFAPPAVDPALGVGAAAAVLATCLLLRRVLRGLHSAEERRRLIVFELAPRTGSERLLRLAAVLTASVAEEAAYRGVLMAILLYSLGSFAAAAGLSALAFGLAHALQGKRGMGLIFVFALLMQALIEITGTLLYAMAVHALYDLIAGYFIAREAHALRTTPAAEAA